MYAGCVVLAIEGTDVIDIKDVPALIATAISALDSSSGDKAKITMRRPPEAIAINGSYRAANMRRANYNWHPHVLDRAVELANHPNNAKRDHAVYLALVRDFGQRVGDDGRMLLPPEQTVTGLCKREWTKRQKAKLDGAQNRAAASVRAGGGGGGGGGSGGEASDGEEEDSDEEEGSSDEGDSDGDDAMRAGAGGRGRGSRKRPVGGERAGGAMGEDGDDGVDALGDVELRIRLGEMGVSAVVKAADLGAGVARSRAVVEPVLRARLRAALDAEA